MTEPGVHPRVVTTRDVMVTTRDVAGTRSLDDMNRLESPPGKTTGRDRLENPPGKTTGRGVERDETERTIGGRPEGIGTSRLRRFLQEEKLDSPTLILQKTGR